MWLFLLISERPAIIFLYSFYLIITEKYLLRDASCIFYYNSGSCQSFEVLISPFCLGGVDMCRAVGYVALFVNRLQTGDGETAPT